jgi:hypothetical protein
MFYDGEEECEKLLECLTRQSPRQSSEKKVGEEPIAAKISKPTTPTVRIVSTQTLIKLFAVGSSFFQLSIIYYFKQTHSPRRR